MSKKKKDITSKEEQAWSHIDNLYEKLQSGKATQEEREQIEGITEIIMNATSNKKIIPITSVELDHIAKSDFEKLTATIDPTTQKSRIRSISRRLQYTAIGIAASVLLVLGISLNMKNKWVNSSATFAGNIMQCFNDSVLYLTDGTKVYLASGSRLAIAADYGKTDRTVSLTGEAFFDVTKDKTKPFIVKTKEVNTLVHGTSFNIVAYPGMAESHIAVSTGCVEVTRASQSFGKLQRGDCVVYDKIANRATLSKVNPENIGTWKDGGFHLEDATVEELKVRIMQRFQRELVIDSEALPANARINYRSYKPGQTDVESVLKNICAIYGASYEINENRINIKKTL